MNKEQNINIKIIHPNTDTSVDCWQQDTTRYDILAVPAGSTVATAFHPEQPTSPAHSNISNPSYRIVEIFESMQGEGYNTGMPAIFIRLGKCSLACPWCDTDYLTYTRMTLQEILFSIQSYKARNIIITGGEPSIHPHLHTLLAVLKQQGFFLCIESNALHPIPHLIDYVAVSPKYRYANRYIKNIISRADEVRIVADTTGGGHSPQASATSEQDFIDWCLWVTQHIQAKHYYLSPLEENGKMNILQTMTLIGCLNETHRSAPNQYPHWQLSLQTHKFADIP